MSEEKLTLKQQRFVDEYMIDFNGRRAAIAAGFSKKCASEIAYEYLRKPHIKAEVEKRLKDGHLGPDSVTKMFVDIARGNVNNYLKKVITEFTPRIKKHLTLLIDELKEEIAFEDEFATTADLTSKDFEMHVIGQEKRRRQLLRYQLELKRNPNATKIVYGEPELIEDMVLDLVAIAKDKENAKIKSFKMTKDGPQVELYNADNALDKIAQIHSMYKTKLDVTMNGNVDPDKWLDAHNTGEAV